MESVAVAKKIEDKAKLLEKGRGELIPAAIEKAQTAAEHSKQLAITLIKLRNGVAFELEGTPIKDPPVSIAEKIAKGICWETQLAADTAEAKYKAVITKLNTVAAEMNGWQSVNRYLDSSVR